MLELPREIATIATMMMSTMMSPTITAVAVLMPRTLPPGCEGCAGAEGCDGAEGAAGDDGADGEEGADGEDGADGAGGDDGDDGYDGVDGGEYVCASADVLESSSNTRAVKRIWPPAREETNILRFTLVASFRVHVYKAPPKPIT